LRAAPDDPVQLETLAAAYCRRCGRWATGLLPRRRAAGPGAGAAARRPEALIQTGALDLAQARLPRGARVAARGRRRTGERSGPRRGGDAQTSSGATTRVRDVSPAHGDLRPDLSSTRRVSYARELTRRRGRRGRGDARGRGGRRAGARERGVHTGACLAPALPDHGSLDAADEAYRAALAGLPVVPGAGRGRRGCCGAGRLRDAIAVEQRAST